MTGDGGRPGRTEGNDRGDSRRYQELVDVAARLLDADTCEFLVEAGDRLVVRATSAAGPAEVDRSYPLWTGIPGCAYTTGKACVVDDTHDIRSAASAGGTPSDPADGLRSLCCVPVGDRGLLLIGATHPGAFSDADRREAERLAELARRPLEPADPHDAPIQDGGTRPNRSDADRLEEIADILSHDLKNPLNVAQGNLELARETGSETHLERAEVALDRIGELIDELVVLARTGGLAEQLEAVDLHEQARAAWQHIQTEKAFLELEEPVTFDGTERGVRHLLENLLDNAITHGGESVTVRVGALDDGFYLEDDGPGIPPAHREHIFDRGYSVDARTTGLGLHIVNRIVEAHGWEIAVREAASGGTRFEVTGVDVHPT